MSNNFKSLEIDLANSPRLFYLPSGSLSSNRPSDSEDVFSFPLSSKDESSFFPDNSNIIVYEQLTPENSVPWKTAEKAVMTEVPVAEEENSRLRLDCEGYCKQILDLRREVQESTQEYLELDRKYIQMHQELETYKQKDEEHMQDLRKLISIVDDSNDWASDGSLVSSLANKIELLVAQAKGLEVNDVPLGYSAVIKDLKEVTNRASKALGRTTKLRKPFK